MYMHVIYCIISYYIIFYRCLYIIWSFRKKWDCAFCMFPIWIIPQIRLLTWVLSCSGKKSCVGLVRVERWFYSGASSSVTYLIFEKRCTSSPSEHRHFKRWLPCRHHPFYFKLVSARNQSEIRLELVTPVVDLDESCQGFLGLILLTIMSTSRCPIVCRVKDSIFPVRYALFA